MKEHRSSPYPFGRALRKHGFESFSFSILGDLTLEEAYSLEESLVGEEEVKSDKYYNISAGGRPDIQLGKTNPMRDPEVVKRHPNIWSTENNPMNCPIRRENHNKHQRRPVVCGGKTYEGVRLAGRILGLSRQMLCHRFKSDNYPDYYYK